MQIHIMTSNARSVLNPETAPDREEDRKATFVAWVKTDTPNETKRGRKFSETKEPRTVGKARIHPVVPRPQSQRCKLA